MLSVGGERGMLYLLTWWFNAGGATWRGTSARGPVNEGGGRGSPFRDQ